jgi:hypothetical protein
MTARLRTRPALYPLIAAMSMAMQMTASNMLSDESKPGPDESMRR